MLADFNFVDAHAAHMAMLEARAQSEERKEKMPSSSLALAGQAEQLRVLRDKILDRLTPKEQQSFPTYRPSR